MPRLTIEQLVQRATGGEKFNRHNLFRPSLTYYLLKDPFWLWCEYHAPKAEAIDETTRYDELRMEHGIEHEVRWVRANFPDAVEIKPGFGFDALKNTFRAMLDGARVIYQPQLWDLRQETYGKGDLLIRDDATPSDLGPYHYRVAADEERIYLEFIDFVGDRRDVSLYHWTDFEIYEMRRVGRRWPALANSLEAIIAHCVDLKTAIQSAVYLPAPSFSIKAVAPALGFHWRQKAIGAYQSMVCYWDYLENRDLFAIDPAITYNQDDCLAMWHIHGVLSSPDAFKNPACISTG
jgi:predicted RecB family nuclease